MLIGQEGEKMMLAVCRHHAAQMKAAVYNDPKLAGAEFWDWANTLRYERLAAQGHSIPDIVTVMDEQDGRAGRRRRRPPEVR